MSVAKDMSICPYCREPINAAATKCKHCQSDLSTARKKRRSLFSQFNTFRYGFLFGVCFSIVLAVLIYIEFFRE